jgi:hypothetical protein
MSTVAKTKFVTETAKTVVNRNASTITKDRLVSAGTPTGQEFAIDGANVGGVSTIVGAIQEGIEAGKSGTAYGPGSIVQLESDGSGTIAYGANLIVVAGASLAASGRVKTLPGTTGTYYLVGRSVSPSTIAATAGLKVLVELCHPTPVYVA